MNTQCDHKLNIQTGQNCPCKEYWQSLSSRQTPSFHLCLWRPCHRSKTNLALEWSQSLEESLSLSEPRINYRWTGVRLVCYWWLYTPHHLRPVSSNTYQSLPPPPPTIARVTAGSKPGHPEAGWHHQRKKNVHWSIVYFCKWQGGMTTTFLIYTMVLPTAPPPPPVIISNSWAQALRVAYSLSPIFQAETTSGLNHSSFLLSILLRQLSCRRALAEGLSQLSVCFGGIQECRVWSAEQGM